MKTIIKRFVLGASVLLALTACAGTVSRSVSEADKDPDGQYDGNYRVSVDHPGGRQLFDNRWYSDCQPMEVAQVFSVSDSVLSWPSAGGVQTSFVNSKGQYRFNLESDGETKGRGNTMSDGRMRTIIQGDLRQDVMAGYLVFGVRQFNYKGCSYPMVITKI